jgi:hypothetical protein
MKATNLAILSAKKGLRKAGGYTRKAGAKELSRKMRSTTTVLS